MSVCLYLNGFFWNAIPPGSSLNDEIRQELETHFALIEEERKPKVSSRTMHAFGHDTDLEMKVRTGDKNSRRRPGNVAGQFPKGPVVCLSTAGQEPPVCAQGGASARARNRAQRGHFHDH